MLKTEELKLVSEWDKTFPKSEKVDHEKVTFVNCLINILFSTFLF